ncbi:MAG: DUF885 family protein [Fimbriimonadaceae bacterium]|nr:DUF885 family protein [Fimbriimonadaceae bacterium]
MQSFNAKGALIAAVCLALCLGLCGSAASQTAMDSELAPRIRNFSADRSSLSRKYPIALSEEREKRFKAFYDEALKDLKKVAFVGLSKDGQVDYILLRNELEHALKQIDLDAKKRKEIAPLMPFAKTILDMAEARLRFEDIDSEKAAVVLNDLKKAVDEAKKAIEDPKKLPDKLKMSKAAGYRGANAIGSLRSTLSDWFKFYNGYDPIFSWWCKEPHKAVDDALKSYESTVRENLAGLKEGDTKTIIGDPIGADGLQAELDYEMIPYTPDQLVVIANKEFAWCEAEMKKASREMGFGDDWMKALEKVKQDHVEPGKQPAMIREMALEAIDFVKTRDLVTVPKLCEETWRMEMMSAERQKASPFFLGGETILVSFPTDTMSQEEKMMSLRGNNRHFCRAVVHHELIPGHHLQGFIQDRYRSYRQEFNTPFWVEGWALHWEFLLWELGFPKTPENRVGMLFWRMHRCARIIFSLSFHLGKMTPQECIDFLVDRVGHERENATAEVRRSFRGDYGPLYQAAYMLGALQINSMYDDLVKTKKMTPKAFHDFVIQQNSIPIEMVRAAMTDQKLTPDFRTSWKFYGEIKG